ncbi:integrase core domain-containing protein [Sphingomonas sp. OTU376]|uniref:integrase core domain-containing protein n=1 Tax=Sphingomonas sp. OTU376 TaxID=3043863 RepID=UPI00406D3EA2
MCLNETLFASLSHARSVLSGWRHDYNHVRPHSGIGGLTPADAARRVVQPRPQGHDDNPRTPVMTGGILGSTSALPYPGLEQFYEEGVERDWNIARGTAIGLNSRPPSMTSQRPACNSGAFAARPRRPSALRCGQIP